MILIKRDSRLKVCPSLKCGSKPADLTLKPPSVNSTFKCDFNPICYQAFRISKCALSVQVWLWPPRMISTTKSVFGALKTSQREDVTGLVSVADRLALHTSSMRSAEVSMKDNSRQPHEDTSSSKSHFTLRKSRHDTLGDFRIQPGMVTLQVWNVTLELECQTSDGYFTLKD